MAGLRLEHIYKVYPNGTKAVSDFTMDIKDKEFIVFVEVKARNSVRYGYPREAVTKQKQQTIKRVAELYLKQKRAYK